MFELIEMTRWIDVGFVAGMFVGAILMGIVIKNNPKRFFRIFYRPDALLSQIMRVVNDPGITNEDTVQTIKNLINIYRGGKKR